LPLKTASFLASCTALMHRSARRSSRRRRRGDPPMPPPRRMTLHDSTSTVSAPRTVSTCAPTHHVSCTPLTPPRPRPAPGCRVGIGPHEAAQAPAAGRSTVARARGSGRVRDVRRAAGTAAGWRWAFGGRRGGGWTAVAQAGGRGARGGRGAGWWHSLAVWGACSCVG